MSCCGDKDDKEKTVMADDRIPAFYEHKNIGKHMVVGLGTRPPVKYGYFGGGRLVPNGVYPADIRARPELFSCGNCRGPFTVTPTEVFCPNCTKSQVTALRQGRPVTKQRDDIVAKPIETPPPPSIVKPEPVSVPLLEIDFGGKKHSYYLGILERAGVTTLDEAKELGMKGLVAISGIGEKTATDILEGKSKNG